MKELEKTYDPSQIEDRLYRKWEEKKYSTQRLTGARSHLRS